jgi:polyisoprenoid-binding protein YceI
MFYICGLIQNQSLIMNKLNLFVFGALASTVMLASCGGTSEPVAEVVPVAPLTVEIDTAASSVKWSGTMVGVYSHEGTLKLNSGSYTAIGDSITAGSFVVNLATIVPTDANYDDKERTPANLVGHLSSADFFDVANFPTASFEVTGVNAEGKVTGNLTVRGVTNAEVLESVAINTAAGTATAALTFDRQKYGVAWASTMKDMVLSNDIVLNVKLKAKG